jgi:hypothetical protein
MNHWEKKSPLKNPALSGIRIYVVFVIFFRGFDGPRRDLKGVGIPIQYLKRFFTCRTRQIVYKVPVKS